jgi:putative phosphoribosyl transferase
VNFFNRRDAGRRLAPLLKEYAGRTDVLVLGIPRGGVLVAFEVALALQVPLDLFILRKLGVPGQEELAFGAIASGGVRYIDSQIAEAACLTEDEINRVSARETRELERREMVYRENRPPLELLHKTIILVDDGIATGASMEAAVRALRQGSPAKLVVAVPVAPLSTCRRLRNEVDNLVCLYSPESFYAIGQFYSDFSQVTDDEVKQLLERSKAFALQKTA